jgi:prevent-host-death family protein
MAHIASRDLRNHTADVLRQVGNGERVTITVNGEPVAELRPVQRLRRLSLTKLELLDVLSHSRADSSLREELNALAGDTTDDLDPLQ